MKNILCVTCRDWGCRIYDMLKNSLPEYNFKIIRDKNSYKDEVIKEFKPDIILWYGWSWIIPPNIVNNYDCICLHPSPLPKYRGGTPIQNQIINGEKMSAITILKMKEGIDDGDIIRQLPMSLSGKIEDIFNRMIKLGFSATCDFLKNGYKLIKQNDKEATYCSRRKPIDSEITHEEIKTKSAEYIYNKIRMLTDPYPNAYITDKNGKKVYITDAYIEED
jgi:methionyl-tRNA formyltransferase